MNLIEAIILGIVQGITEWLPISSEGITSLIMINFFGKTIKDAIPIAIWLHMGTLLAAIIYFRKDIIEMVVNIPNYIKNFREKSEINSLISFLIIATFFSGLIGIPLMLFILDNLNFPGGIATAIIGLLLIITGVLHFIAKKEELVKKILLKDSILVGIVQAFAVFPGLSRSGLTTAVLLLNKYTAKQALRLSFLLSIPLILIAEIGIGLLNMVEFDIYSFVAVLVAFVFGLLTISLLIKVAEKINFGYFCLFLGVLSFLALLG